MTHKTLLPMLVITGLALACFSTKAKDLAFSRKIQDEVIPLNIENTEVDPHSPRTSAFIPISCYLNESFDHICFSFSYPLGDVTITLTEAVAGIVSEGKYSSSYGDVSISVPGPGMYDVNIIIESGIEFVGHFISY